MTKRAACLGSWLALAACAGAPPPLAEPPIDLTVAPVLRPDTATADVATDVAARSRLVRVEVLALRVAPSGPSLDDATLAIVAERGAPFRAVTDLPSGCQWIAGDDAAALPERSSDDRRSLGVIEAPVVPGVETVVVPSLPSLPTLRFTLDGGACRLQIEAPPDADAARDRVLLREPLTAPHVLFVPGATAPAAGRAFVIVPGGEVEPGLAAATIAAARAAAASASVTVAEREVQIAASSLGEHNRRPALLALARRFALPRCVDAVLAADEPLLAAMTTATCDPRGDTVEPSWQFERAVFAATLPALQRDELPPAMFACLVRHFGALALDATTLQMRLETAADRATFDRALLEENDRALESRDPVWRVRAHDWLGGHAKVVPGFDPMADVASRRAALRHGRSAATEPR